MSVTYDLNTVIGKTRLFANDRVIASAYFTDEEILAFLADVNNIPILAAAQALRAKSNDPAYIAKSFSIGKYSESNGNISSSLISQADALEAKALELGIGADGQQAAYEAVAEIAYTEAGFIEIMRNNKLRGEEL